MPELRARYAYPICLAVMAVIGFGLLGWFWHRGWIGPRAQAAARSARDAAAARRER
jgi:hypothetical protein